MSIETLYVAENKLRTRDVVIAEWDSALEVYRNSIPGTFRHVLAGFLVRTLADEWYARFHPQSEFFEGYGY